MVSRGYRVAAVRRGAWRLLFFVVLIAVSGGVAAAPAEPEVRVVESEGMYRVSATFSVPQPASTVTTVLMDFERIPQYMPDIKVSAVRERSREGVLVEQEATAHFLLFSKTVHLMLRVTQDAGTIRFHDQCGESFEQYDGAWHVTEKNARTAIVYRLSAKPRFDVPGFVLKKLLKRDATDMIERLRNEFATRAVASSD